MWLLARRDEAESRDLRQPFGGLPPSFLRMSRVYTDFTSLCLYSISEGSYSGFDSALVRGPLKVQDPSGH